MRPTPNSGRPIPALPLLTVLLALLGLAPPAVVQAQNAPPVITAPATITAREGEFFSVTITAISADSTRTVTLTGPAPFCGIAFSSFPGVGRTTGTLSGTPGFNCAGSYAVTFTANDGVASTSSTSALTILNTDRAPVVTAPATAVGNENTLLTIIVSASDPDGDAISSFTAAGTAITAGGTFVTNSLNTSGTFSWTPSFTHSGTYGVTFTASNARSGSATTVITISEPHRAPVVTAPAIQSVGENQTLTFTISASDPDGEAISSLTAAGPPFSQGATFTAGAGNTSGTFSWTTSFTSAGVYTVTFTASNTLSGTATTTITVCDSCGDGPPVVTAPATVSGSEGVPITFTILASDPDGDAITSFTATGSAITAGGTFTKNATNTMGTFNWTPNFTQTGVWSVTFIASNTLSGTATTSITVGGPPRAPVVLAPLTVDDPDFSPISFTVSAADPDGDPITSLTASGSAFGAGAVFAANAANTSGTFDWAPTAADEGAYSATFLATSGSPALSGSATTQITVGNPDHPPVVTSPGSASGDEGTLITFTVAASDPDGDSITSLTAAPLPVGASFAVNASNTSGTFAWTPTYTQAGNYTVTFRAANALAGNHSTFVIVREAATARAFTTGSYKAIRLNSGKAQWCVHVEPTLGSFQISDIQLGSVVMRSTGTGSVTEISAYTGKTTVSGDVDNNGVEDAEFCFTKGNLQLLFANLTGKTTVNVTIAGRLISGATFAAPLSIDVTGGGGAAAAQVVPNPLNPSGTLSFRTVRGGAVRVRLFDGAGRLVRTVFDASLPAGAHALPLDPRDRSGRPLASGVYFYRVDGVGETATGRFVVAK